MVFPIRSQQKKIVSTASRIHDHNYTMGKSQPIDDISNELQQPLLADDQEQANDILLSDAVPVVVAEPVSSESMIRSDVILPSNNNQGRWRDGLFNCFPYGCCHPSFCLPLFCPFIGIAQVMRRMSLNLIGRRGNESQATLTFSFIFSIAFIISYFGPKILTSSLGIAMQSLEGANQTFVMILPCSIATFFLFYLIVITRRAIRKRENIPNGCCGPCDDCFVSALFPCCAIGQAMRHTANYNVYRAIWISTTGLPDGLERNSQPALSVEHTLDQIVESV